MASGAVSLEQHRWAHPSPGGEPSELHAAVQTLLQEIIRDHGSVIFNGDGYSDEWHREAEERGLPNLKTTADALPVLASDEVVSLFESYGVLTKRETLSRLEVYLEQYCLSVGVEARTTIEMARTIIFPSAIRYQGELAATCASLKEVGMEPETSALEEVTALVQQLQREIAVLETVTAAEPAETTQAHAEHCRHEILPAMLAVRATADALEGTVADDLWRLATYQEMLFIK